MGKNRKYRNNVAEGRILPNLKELGQMLLTFFLVVIGWIIFRAESIGQAWAFIGQMCTSSILSVPDAPGVTGFSVAIVLMLVVEWVQRDKPHAFDLANIQSCVLRYVIYVFILFLTFSLGGRAENFIYFQF